MNGIIENTRLSKKLQDKSDGFAVSIILDEIERLSYKIYTLITENEIDEVVQLEIDEKSKITNDRIKLLRLMIGTHMFVENLDYVQEITIIDHSQLESNNKKGREFFILRGMKIPIINLYDKWNLIKNKVNEDYGYTAVIINAKWKEKINTYAVLVNSFSKHSVFTSRFGVASKCKLEKYIGLTRECWNCAEEKQAVFLDWDNLFDN